MVGVTDKNKSDSDRVKYNEKLDGAPFVLYPIEMQLVYKRTRLGARLLLRAAVAPLSRLRDIRTAERLADLEICDDTLYEGIFANLGYPSFQPWATSCPAKALWKTLGGRPTLAQVRETTPFCKDDVAASFDWLYLPYNEFQKRLSVVS